MKTTLNRENCAKAPTGELTRHVDEILDARHRPALVAADLPETERPLQDPPMPMTILRTLIKGIGARH